ncbi:MAG: 50S ribosomal protein L3 [Candidatus Algichlamydia australiensis]|nr:50S ribosomal protein L3 [Chlamydiales bacterium]
MTFIKGRKSFKLLGRKLGMTKVFDETGGLIPCTVIRIEPNVVIQKKEKASDGYDAVQVGAFSLNKSQKKNMAKPVAGHFAAAKQEQKKLLKEFHVEDLSQYEVGQELSVALFQDVTHVDVVGTSKGKGFQGVMKRHGFKGGRASHGSGNHREMGSTGMCSYPGRTFKKKKMPGHMGDVRVTMEGLKVVKCDEERGLLIVKGAVPGSNGGTVYVRKALKRYNNG